MSINIYDAAELFDEELASFLVDARRKDIKSDWQKVEATVDYLPVVYTRALIDYQTAYWTGHENAFLDMSVVLYFNHRPVGIWPLSLIALSNKIQIGSFGGVLCPPIFDRQLPNKSANKLILACQEFLRALCLKWNLREWESAESFPQHSWLSNWHLNAMKNGAVAKMRHDLFVDLSLDISLIKQCFRESYKSLINSSKNHFDIHVFGNSNSCAVAGFRVWEDFRVLHLASAGRVTRSEETWNLQYKSILSGDAFLAYANDKTGKLVGGALFNISKSEGYYSVGAYDRDLFDKPIGHAIQFRAIEEMKKLAIRFYHIGDIHYPGENLERSEKQNKITHFKSGFATHIFPRFIIKQRV